MARVTTYLTFKDSTERAFEFYKSVFGGEYIGAVSRYKDAPADPEQSCLAEAESNLILHIELAITGGHVLMGSDAPESMGFSLVFGNTVNINLEPDTRAEADRLFNSLSEGGHIGMPMQDMFWGAYFGHFTDKFGIHWMVNFPHKN